MKLMRLSIRIPLGLTIAVVLIGIIAFTKISCATAHVMRAKGWSAGGCSQ